ncbi:hypothetical protein SUGI_0217940 [Cryptomeria japonica]|uniref:pectinesterase inhibitor 9 n=1 Tax=Cryptomeria japonica TaxID=3369 RepID=UPI00240896CA|nr:pectinesterase inhibitor 9 [Cryptomeria japonica]GLJ13674.1 hypothetical protein SUGI_0217940 [Cryptomeria japonica]
MDYSTSRVRIAMDFSTLFFLFTVAAILAYGAGARRPGDDFIESSCKITRYPNLCVASLRSYAPSLQAKRSQKELVKAAVKVSLQNSRNMTVWAARLSRRAGDLSKRERGALRDCLENFDDTSEQIRESLAELKHLRSDTFKFQMSNVQTWMSAALTNEDSCLDGFQDVGKGRVKVLVNGRVQHACELISNALALVNKLAGSTTGY